MSDLLTSFAFSGFASNASVAGLLPITVLALAFLGSPHCLMMCGPICYMAGQQDKVRLTLYHIGRLLSYLLVGSIFGFLGGVLLREVQSVLAVLSGFFLGGVFLFSGLMLLSMRKPGWLTQLPTKATEVFVRRVMHFGARTRAFFLGALSGFLPCGFLYVFMLAALATQSAVFGAGILFLFWLGTVPVLSAGIYFLQRLRARWPHMQQGFRYTMGVLFVVYGVMILWPRMETLVSVERPVATSSQLLICE